MTSDKADELATDIDDALADAEDLEFEPNADVEKVGELEETLRHAAETIDRIADDDEEA
jgi:hypothetical protein